MKTKVRIRDLKKGTLGGPGFFSKTDRARHMKESKDVKKYGFRAVAGKLVAIEVLNKNRNPSLSSKAKRDEKYLRDKYRSIKR